MDLPAPVSPVNTLNPGREHDVETINERKIADMKLQQQRPSPPQVL